MKKGKDYIVFPLDFSEMDEARQYMKLLGKRVGMFKIGLELFVLGGPDVVRQVKDMTGAGVFLDLKFHDISVTVKRAMAQVARLGVDLVTVHCASSLKMLQMAVEGGQGRTGVLGVTLLTDNDSAVVKASGYREEFSQSIDTLVLKRARMAYDAGCAGVVCSGREAGLIKSEFGSRFLAVTPGIRPAWSLVAGDDQQRITTPSMAVQEGADLIVVGRPIKTAADPGSAADRIAEEIDTLLNQSSFLSSPKAV